MTNFKTMQDAHLALLARQDAAPNDPALPAAAEAYIAEVTAGSTWVADPGERDLLRAYLRYWAGVIYQQRGIYPKTELRPAETTAAVRPVAPAPAEREPSPTTTPAPRRGLPGWLWLLGGLLGLLLILGAASMIFLRAGQGSGQEVVDPSVPDPATPLPSITRTPSPQTPVPAVPIDQSNATQVQALTRADAHTGGALAVDFDPQKPEVATAGADGAVRFWTVPALTLSRQLNDQRGWVRSVDYSPYGDRSNVPALFLTGGNDGLLRVYDLESLQLFAEYRPSAVNPGFVFAARFSPDGLLIASGHGDGQARIWNVDTGTESGALSPDVSSRLAQIPSGGAAVRDVAFAADGSALALALSGTENGVLIMDSTYTTPVCVISGGAAAAVAYSPRGDRLAAGLEDGNLVIAALSDCPQPRNYYNNLAHAGGVTDVAFSPGGDWLVTGGRDGTLKLWSPEGQWLAEMAVGAAVEAVAVSADAGYIASVDANGRLILWGIP